MVALALTGNDPALCLNPNDYQRLRDLLYSAAGIELGADKQALVYSRLMSRVENHAHGSFERYVRKLYEEPDGLERRIAIDLLTTNETYFWREPQHFDFLQEHARRIGNQRGSLSIWSAASSSGEEAFTIAMVLQALVDQGVPLQWDIMGSDLSDRMLEMASRGVYPEVRITQLPDALRKRYCLRGTGPAQGTAMVVRELRERIDWQRINLVEPLPAVGPFDVIFLRNVLIYFDRPTKQRVLEALASRLNPGGLIIVGLTEGLVGVKHGLRSLQHGIYTPKH